MDCISDIFHTVEGTKCALNVMITGALTLCGNWRGISLLEVMGNSVFTKMILIRLQKVAEKALPDSQRDFQTGRGERSDTERNLIHPG